MHRTSNFVLDIFLFLDIFLLHIDGWVRLWNYGYRGHAGICFSLHFLKYCWPIITCTGSSSLQTYTRLCVLDQCQQRKCHQSLELKIVLHSVIRLQRWWRKFLFHQSVRTSVISIQSFVRGWLARKRVNRIVCCINIIQVCVLFF